MKKGIKRPIPEHDEAFEIYFKCRNVAETAREIGKHRVTISGWKKRYRWDDRCVVRERDIHKGIDEKFVAEVVDKKAEMLKTLHNMDTIIDQGIRTAFVIDPNTGKHILKYKIESYRGLLDTITLKLKVNDNRLKVLGEDLFKSDIDASPVQIIDNIPQYDIYDS